jgi:hypothetical protein
MNMHVSWDDLWDEARQVDILSVADRLGIKLRRSGKDWTSSCPAGCSSKDGLVLTPSRGVFVCRKSGEGGDAVSLVAHCQGCSKQDALEFVLNREIAGKREETEEEREERQRKREGWEKAARERDAQLAKEEAERAARDDEEIASILKRAVPIQQTHAADYLREARGLTPPKALTGDLKFVKDLAYYGLPNPGAAKKELLATLPAMVAIIRNVAGEIIGLSTTYLDPTSPNKWKPIGGPQNSARKIRGDKQGGLIRLGILGEKIALGEGVETTLSWHALGRCPDDASLAATVDLGNMSGRWTGTTDHPTNKRNGRPTPVPNGIPDMEHPGAILPPYVKEVILLGDGDSEPIATRRAVLTGVRRYEAEGRTVTVDFAPDGKDFSDVLMKELFDGVDP